MKILTAAADATRSFRMTRETTRKYDVIQRKDEKICMMILMNVSKLPSRLERDIYMFYLR